MVAFGAIHAGLSHRRKRQQQAGARRRRAAQEHWKRQKEINERLDIIFKKYDTDQSGRLDREQVANIMTDLDGSTPPGTRPPEEEIDYIMHESAGTDSEVSREELSQMIALWASYVKEKQIVEDSWDRHDTDRSGTLGREQLRTLLIELNEGEDVPLEEVDFLMGLFDADKSGDLKRVEATRAVHCWYIAHEEKEEEPGSRCCTVQ
eukprot:TRINITY_DN4569_c0_g1_i1.p1 TRINITY_DN4569_c0_g1~~TRINITY_DN4569_c0_g1_i1.p1  ORF type:complete len:228 (+),score=49.22 TRINITY_DN4569_c0_g1_i1:69-686(+)